jgi:hypothetical protein
VEQASNTSRALSKTYPAAAEKARQQCGNSYAQMVLTSGGMGLVDGLGFGAVMSTIAVATLLGVSTLVPL